MQQKYWDQGRSTALLTTTWPIFLARELLRIGGEAEERVDLAVREQLRSTPRRRG